MDLRIRTTGILIRILPLFFRLPRCQQKLIFATKVYQKSVEIKLSSIVCLLMEESGMATDPEGSNIRILRTRNAGMYRTNMNAL
jgi:hypothetical protein